MSTPRSRAARCGALIATLTLALAASPAAAQTGGASVAASAPAPAPTPATAELQQRTVRLTRTQTKSVQRRVKVKADGVLGAGTRRAIRRFQVRKQLKATGRPNVETLRALGLRLADKLEAKLVAQAQRAPGDAASGDGHPEAVDAARRAIGTPYRTGGNSTAGFDCSGLTVWAMKRAGIRLPRTSFQQYREGEAVGRDEIQAGDLVFFDTAGPGASHVGIATGPTKVISATSRGVMEHRFDAGYWDAHYIGARRV